METTKDLGITLGNPEAKWRIVEVCNPYCTPCAWAHLVLDNLLDNQEFELQIIFTVTNDERNKPIYYFLALQEARLDVRQVLVDWFSDKEKKYAEFVEQHDYMDDNMLDAQIDKVEKMREWCNKMGIMFTPMTFVNNHQLPDVYTVTDLYYLLSV